MSDYIYGERSDGGYEIAELMCLKCKSRWIGVYPAKVTLKEIMCEKCKEVGYVIKTGQTLPDERPCDTCRFFNDKYNNCRLGLSGTNPYCDYRQERSNDEA